MSIPSLSIGAGLIELGGGLAATAAFLVFVGALLTALAYLEPGTMAARPQVRRNRGPQTAPAVAIPAPATTETGAGNAGTTQNSHGASPIPIAQGGTLPAPSLTQLG